MKKSIIFIFIATLGMLSSYAQVGIGTSNPNPAAVLELSSTNQGMLFPRMTTANLPANPATGLTVFNITDNCLQTNIGTPAAPIWKCLGPAPCPIPAGITLASNAEYTIYSLLDANYRPWTVPTAAATTGNSNPDGTTETITQHVQGKITAAGITIRIPVTVTINGTLPAYTSSIAVVPGTLTSDGLSKNVQLSWSATALTTTSKYINATLKSLSGDFELVQLDLNCGLGPDYKGIFATTIPYIINNTCALSNLTLRISPAIVDKMIGQADNAGNSTHQMFYLPVVAADGSTWLNNNLGANYSNINSLVFNISQQASPNPDHGNNEYSDYDAYGSLIQWGRKTDGHELVTWLDFEDFIPVYVSINIRPENDAPTHPNFIYLVSPFDNYDWRGATQNDALWATEASPNNPCPVGYRVPNEPEFTNMLSTSGITNSINAYNSVMKFTTPGWRDYDNGFAGGYYGLYSTSTISTASPHLHEVLLTTFLQATIQGHARASGSSVRCIKD